MISEYYMHEHVNVNENSVYKFFNRNYNLLDGISFIGFLKYNGGTNLSNADRIFSKYTEVEKSVYRNKIYAVNQSLEGLLKESDFIDLPLKCNTNLLIPKSKFISELVSVKGKNLFLEQKDHDFFFASKLLQLLNDPQYVKDDDILYNSNYNSLEIINQNIQVWVWSRALEKIINISPFITQLSTSKSDVGSFSFQLSPLFDINDVDFLDSQEILNFFPNSIQGKSNIDFFYKKLQYNDLAFIRFERLKLDETDKDSFENSLEISKNKLPNRVWDMIGLIDTVQQSSMFNNNDHIVSVSGRDLMKLLIEDGSYFMSLRYLSNGDTIVGYDREDRWFKRIFFDKDNATNYSPYKFFNERRSISDTIGFIINQLSNLGIVEDNLFDSYDKNDEEKGRRTQKYIVSGESEDNLSIEEINGIWQIVKVFFDDRLADRRVTDASIAHTDATILEQFNKICQRPFVEFYGDTYGDEFDFVVRQPPFNKEMIKSFLYPKRGISYKSGLEGNYQIITLEEKDIEGYGNMQWDETRYSWYQLHPHDNMLGKYSLEAAGGLIPIVYFDKLANIYGSKRLVINDNYLSANIIEGKGADNDSSKYREALLNDLKYIIDTTSYLPFTRKGTITIPKGDRRIKRGTFIRIAPTNEIFYVDSVSHNFSISGTSVDRSTSLSLSRGMLEEYILGGYGYDDIGLQIYGKRDRELIFSYFDIIETKIITKPTVIEEVVENRRDIVNNSDENKFSVIIPERSRIAFVHNNPGNLEFRNQRGAEPGELRRYDTKGNPVYWAKFNTSEDGFRAVVNQVRIDKGRNKTLAEFIYKYAPPKDNGVEKTEEYLRRAKLELNASSTTPIKNIESFDFAKFIVKQESSTKVSGKKADNVLVDENKEVKRETIKKTINRTELVCKLNEEQFDFFTKRFQFNKSL